MWVLPIGSTARRVLGDLSRIVLSKLADAPSWQGTREIVMWSRMLSSGTRK